MSLAADELSLQAPDPEPPARGADPDGDALCPASQVMVPAVPCAVLADRCRAHRAEAPHGLRRSTAGSFHPSAP